MRRQAKVVAMRGKLSAVGRANPPQAPPTWISLIDRARAFVVFVGGRAIALRSQLIEIERTKLAAVGKNEKMEVLYRYLSGSEFKQRVEAVVEAFIEMQEDLQEERRISERR